jgi:hypothetical protein
MKSGIRRSSDTGASQPTPRDPINMNMDPVKPARIGDRGSSISAP